VTRKKASLFSTILRRLVSDFYDFCSSGNRNEYVTVYLLNGLMNDVITASRGTHVICSLRWTWPTAFWSMFDRSGCLQHLQKLGSMFAFSNILVGKLSTQSLDRNPFTFRQLFDRDFIFR